MSVSLEKLLPKLYESVGSELQPPVRVYKRLGLIGRLIRGLPPIAGARRLVSLDDAGGVIAHRLRRMNVIGRNPDCDIVVRNPRVSRQHCVVSSIGAKDGVVDLQSRNGTFVNGVRIARRILSDGDVIEVGGTPFVYTNDPLSEGP